MALINWKNEYSVSVQEIDEQHKKLISLINELHGAMTKGKTRDIISTIVNGLVEYTVSHFSTEEVYFDKFNYNLKLAHIQEHKTFIKKVSEFREKFEKGDVAVSIEVMHFLRDWLTNHILCTDKKYTRCFNDNGLL